MLAKINYKEREVKRGDDLKLESNLDNYFALPNSVKWHLNGIELHNDVGNKQGNNIEVRAGVLKIMNADAKLDGKISCKSSNKMGNFIEEVTELKVKGVETWRPGKNEINYIEGFK